MCRYCARTEYDIEPAATILYFVRRNIIFIFCTREENTFFSINNTELFKK